MIKETLSKALKIAQSKNDDVAIGLIIERIIANEQNRLHVTAPSNF